MSWLCVLHTSSYSLALKPAGPDDIVLSIPQHRWTFPVSPAPLLSCFRGRCFVHACRIHRTCFVLFEERSTSRSCRPRMCCFCTSKSTPRGGTDESKTGEASRLKWRRAQCRGSQLVRPAAGRLSLLHSTASFCGFSVPPTDCWGGCVCVCVCEEKRASFKTTMYYCILFLVLAVQYVNR